VIALLQKAADIAEENIERAMTVARGVPGQRSQAARW
jgi:hypothetical protein